MTNEPSQRPWRSDEYDASLVRDADGRFIARADAADASDQAAPATNPALEDLPF